MSIGYLGMAVMRFTALIGSFNQQFYEYSQELARLSEDEMFDGVGEENKTQAMRENAKGLYANNPALQAKYASYMHMPFITPGQGSASKSFGAGFVNNGGPVKLKDITAALIDSGNFNNFLTSLKAGGGKSAGYSSDGKALSDTFARLSCAATSADGKDPTTGKTKDELLGDMLKNPDFSKYLANYLIATGVARQNSKLDGIINTSNTYNGDRNGVAAEIIADATAGNLSFNSVPMDYSVEDVYRGMLDGGLTEAQAQQEAKTLADGCSDGRFANTPAGGAAPTQASIDAAKDKRPLFERISRAVVQPIGATLQSRDAKRSQIRIKTTQIEQKMKSLQTKIQMFEGMLQSAEKALQKAIQRIFGGQGG